MSWSVAAKGKIEEVKAAVAEQFEKASECAEPEETLRQKAAELISDVLDAQGYFPNVEVNAFGSQSVGDGGVCNSLNIRIMPHS
jgi:hypothetical protein